MLLAQCGPHRVRIPGHGEFHHQRDRRSRRGADAGIGVDADGAVVLHRRRPRSAEGIDESRTVRDIGISECAKVHDAAAWHEQGYLSAQNAPAQEDIFGFGDAQSAAQAFSAIASGLNACAQTTRDLQRAGGAPQDAVVATMATAPQARAWSRRWTGVAGQSAAGAQTNHYYLVQRGSIVILASFTEFGANPPNPYDPAGDPAVLTMLTATVGG